MLYTITPSLRKKYRRILVAGDMHGDYEGFRALKEQFDEKNDILILLGDYADRGDAGVEIIEELSEWQRRGADNIAMLYGNHELFSAEGKPRFRPCDLLEEAERKRGSWATFFSDTMQPFLKGLYHAALLPGEILFVHGGLSPELENRYALTDPDEKLVTDLLWSDPVAENITAKFNSRRGEGVLFGEKLTRRVCSLLDVKKIIRSHQPELAKNGPAYMHSGRVITINSTASYFGQPHMVSISLADPSSLETVFLK
jgi:diadenosine tetraphosphatase ApaH/serine/threonine PP2A family protein phosphatase